VTLESPHGHRSNFSAARPGVRGTKFGPFTGVEVRLGSDPNRNDIVLPEALGVLPAHVRVIKQQDQSFIVAPTERTATVYLHRTDGRPPRAIATPTAVQAGDAFSLVTAEGPRFFILVEQPTRQAMQEAVAPPKDEGPGVAGGVFSEIRRVGLAKVMTSKVGNFFQTAWMMIKTGTIFSPRYIVMGMMMIVPLMMAGGASCAAFSFHRSAAQKDDQIDELEADLDACGGGDQGEDPTIGSLTQAILGDRLWKQSMDSDPGFNTEYLKQLKSIFGRPDRYAWVYQRKKSDLTDLMGRLGRGMGDSLTRVFSYVAAQPGYVPDREWTLIRSNSEGNRSCARGPAILSYRQAVNLGITPQPDALADPGLASSDDLELKAAALKKTMGADQRDFENDEIQQEGAGLQGGFQCLYLQGDDPRDDVSAIASAMTKQLGPKARGMPDETGNFWITSRLVKFYAADFLLGYDDLKFSSDTPPSLVLDESSPTQKTFALNSAAEVTARAVAIPCLAVLNKASTDHLGTSPTLVQCGLLRILLDQGS